MLRLGHLVAVAKLEVSIESQTEISATSGLCAESKLATTLSSKPCRIDRWLQVYLYKFGIMMGSENRVEREARKVDAFHVLARHHALVFGGRGGEYGVRTVRRNN